MRGSVCALLGPCLMLACAPLDEEEAGRAYRQSRPFAAASILISNTVESATRFELTNSRAEAVSAIREYYQTNHPCAELELDGEHLVIDYGSPDTPCSVRGLPVSGLQRIRFASLQKDRVDLDMIWTDLGSDLVRVSGTGEVAFSPGIDGRRVEHDAEWVWLEDGSVFSGVGSRIEEPLYGDLEFGLRISGTSNWQSDHGFWGLTISRTGHRWVDPIPEEGSYLLNTPFNKSVVLSFERSGPTTVSIDASNRANEVSFPFELETPPRD